MEFAAQTEYNEGAITTIINESGAADHKAFSRAPARARRAVGVRGDGCKAIPTTTALASALVVGGCAQKKPFSPYKLIPKRAHLKKHLSIKKIEKVNFSLQISENGVSKSILKELQKLS